MKTVDITVLAYDGPVVHSYLLAMRDAGYMPRKIICLNMLGIGKKWTLVRCLSGRKGERYVRRIRENRRFPSSERAKLFKLLSSKLDRLYPELTLERFPYRDYGVEVVSVDIKGINDPKLVKLLSLEKIKTYLFTGGGILEESYFQIPDAIFIHVHPGIVPDIRGADGFLWSLLLRGRVGMSCFFMNSGVDTGEIVGTAEYSFPKIHFVKNKYSSNMIYEAILHFVDPVFRARLFVDILRDCDGNFNYFRGKTRKQSLSEGRYYSYFHPVLRDMAIEKYIVRAT